SCMASAALYHPGNPPHHVLVHTQFRQLAACQLCRSLLVDATPVCEGVLCRRVEHRTVIPGSQANHVRIVCLRSKLIDPSEHGDQTLQFVMGALRCGPPLDHPLAVCRHCVPVGTGSHFEQTMLPSCTDLSRCVDETMYAL